MWNICDQAPVGNLFLGKGDFGATKMRFGGGEERAARVAYVPLASSPLLPSGRALRRNAAELQLEAEKRVSGLPV
jgi:hypothetical protein